MNKKRGLWNIIRGFLEYEGLLFSQNILAFWLGMFSLIFVFGVSVMGILNETASTTSRIISTFLLTIPLLFMFLTFPAVFFLSEKRNNLIITMKVHELIIENNLFSEFLEKQLSWSQKNQNFEKLRELLYLVEEHARLKEKTEKFCLETTESNCHAVLGVLVKNYELQTQIEELVEKYD